jgi:hypothetical protein
MEKSQKVIAQIYGYTICLVAVITLLVTINSFVNALFDLQDPLHAASASFRYQEANLSSFESYKMDVLKSPQRGGNAVKENPYIPDDKTLNVMYEAARADKIQSVRHSAHQSLTLSPLLIVICSILFVTHWRWMKKIRTDTVS